MCLHARNMPNHLPKGFGGDIKNQGGKKGKSSDEAQEKDNRGAWGFRREGQAKKKNGPERVS